MTQEPQKSSAVLIVIAIIGVIGTIVASAIGAMANYNIEKERQGFELTRIALVSIATQGGATQMVLESTVNAPTQPPEPTSTPYPTYTPQIIPTVTSSPEPTIFLPIEDTFDLRARPEWETITGTWRVLDGHLTADNSDEWQIAFIGDSNWQNYKMEVTIFSSYFVYPTRLIARASDKGYIAFEYTASGARWIIINSGQEVEITEMTNHFDWDKTYNIALKVEGDIFTVLVNGTQYSQIQDSTFSKGKVGLGFKSPYLTWFDDFQVSELP